MTSNVGTADRVVRFIIGLIVIGLGVYYKSWFGAIGIIPLFTSLVRWCPLYLPFGLSTCARNQAKESTD